MPNRPAADGITEDAVLGGRLRLRQPRARPSRRPRRDPAGGGMSRARRRQGRRSRRRRRRRRPCARGARPGHDGDAGRDRSASLPRSPTKTRGSIDWRRACARSTLDVAAPARAFAAAGLGADSVARVLMNPPFNDPRRQRVVAGCRAARSRTRRRARCSPPGSRPRRGCCAPRGTLTLIWRADGLADVLAALAPAFGAVAVTPVHPAPDKPAIRILVTAVEGEPGAAHAAAAAGARGCVRTPDSGSRGGAARRHGVADAGSTSDDVTACPPDCAMPKAARRRSKTSVRAFLRWAAAADVRCGRNRGDQRQQDKDLDFHCRSPSHPGLRQRDVARSVPMVENW